MPRLSEEQRRDIAIKNQREIYTIKELLKTGYTEIQIRRWKNVNRVNRDAFRDSPKSGRPTIVTEEVSYVRVTP